jgi:hypothetical protein
MDIPFRFSRCSLIYGGAVLYTRAPGVRNPYCNPSASARDRHADRQVVETGMDSMSGLAIDHSPTKVLVLKNQRSVIS